MIHLPLSVVLWKHSLSELLENLEDVFPRYYNIWNISTGSNLQSHAAVLPVSTNSHLETVDCDDK